MSMNEDTFAGTGKNMGGRVEQGLGRAAGDVKTQVEGKMKQATGAAQDIYGQAKDAAGEAWAGKRCRWRRNTVGAGTRCTIGTISAQRYRKSAVYLVCRAGPRLVHRPYGRTFGLLGALGMLPELVD